MILKATAVFTALLALFYVLLLVNLGAFEDHTKEAAEIVREAKSTMQKIHAEVDHGDDERAISVRANELLPELRVLAAAAVYADSKPHSPRAAYLYQSAKRDAVATLAELQELAEPTTQRSY
jgi:hypothetical protein